MKQYKNTKKEPCALETVKVKKKEHCPREKVKIQKKEHCTQETVNIQKTEYCTQETVNIQKTEYCTQETVNIQKTDYCTQETVNIHKRKIKGTNKIDRFLNYNREMQYLIKFKKRIYVLTFSIKLNIDLLNVISKRNENVSPRNKPTINVDSGSRIQKCINVDSGYAIPYKWW